MSISKELLFFLLSMVSLFFLQPIVTLIVIGFVTYIFFRKSCKLEFGISLLFFGVSVFGYIGIKIGLSPLGKLSGLLGLYLVKESLSSLRQLIPLFFTLTVSFFICLLFYLLGPKTAVASEKLFDVIYYSIIYVVLFNALFYYRERINYVVFSRISICYVLLYISYAVAFDLNDFEHVIKSLSGLRTAVDYWSIENIIYSKDGFGDTVSSVSYQLVGNFTALSLVILLTNIFSSRLPGSQFRRFKFLILVHFIIILLSGARQSIVLVLISSASLFLCGNRVDRTYLAKFSLSVILLMILVVIAGLMMEVRSIVNVFQSEGGFSSVINRQVNIDAAYELIQAKPWFGFGFGGYFIPEYGFKSGEFRYFPHNILLELLSEFGIIGTLTFLATWFIHYFFKYIHSKVNIINSEVYPGFFALPLFSFYLISALMNEILVKSIALFIIVSFMLSKRSSRA